jgi:hypothetical protein
LFGRTKRDNGRRKKENSETYNFTIAGEGQERTAVATEAGQVQEVPNSAGHQNLRRIIPNESSDDEVSSEDSTMMPGAVRIPGANATSDDEDDQITFFETSTAAPPELVEPELVEAELALDLDEEIALGVQSTLQQAIQATAVPVRRKPWRIIWGIASVLILAVVAILIIVLPLETPYCRDPRRWKSNCACGDREPGSRRQRQAVSHRQRPPLFADAMPCQHHFPAEYHNEPRAAALPSSSSCREYVLRLLRLGDDD